MSKYKEECRRKNIQLLKDMNIDYLQCTDYHFKLTFCGDQVADFYPSTNKWCVGKTVYHGNAETLWDWIGEQEEKLEKRREEVKSKVRYKDFNEAVEELL